MRYLAGVPPPSELSYTNTVPGYVGDCRSEAAVWWPCCHWAGDTSSRLTELTVKTRPQHSCWGSQETGELNSCFRQLKLMSNYVESALHHAAFNSTGIAWTSVNCLTHCNYGTKQLRLCVSKFYNVLVYLSGVCHKIGSFVHPVVTWQALAYQGHHWS